LGNKLPKEHQQQLAPHQQQQQQQQATPQLPHTPDKFTVFIAGSFGSYCIATHQVRAGVLWLFVDTLCWFWQHIEGIRVSFSLSFSCQRVDDILWDDSWFVGASWRWCV
jgi:hypothetical protein